MSGHEGGKKHLEQPKKQAREISIQAEAKKKRSGNFRNQKQRPQGRAPWPEMKLKKQKGAVPCARGNGVP